MTRPKWSSLLNARAALIALVMLVPCASPRRRSLCDAAQGPLVARVYARDKDHLDAVAGELDIWEAHADLGYVVAALSAGQHRWLEDLGYRVEREPEITSVLGPALVLDPRYYYFDEQHPNPSGRHVVDFLREIDETYPDLTELIDVGDAWMATEPGEAERDIWVLRVTNENAAYGPVPEKPAFFLSAAVHAREVTTAELALRFVRYLTAGWDGKGGYGVDADVTWLVDHHVAYVLVMHNPDGHVENEESVGKYRRKNMDWDDGCSEPDFWGVDLNRNHSFLWSCCGGSSSNPCRETYRGPSRCSEPETRALETYFGTVMKDQNGPNGHDEIAPASPVTTTGIFISLHSYGDVVLWPWGFDDYGSAPNDAQLRTIGRKLAAYNGYSASGTIWYDVDGATDDWAYGEFGIASFTVEVGPQTGACGGFYPLYDCLDGYAGRNFWAENAPALLYAHRIARTPYITAYGPDVESLAVSSRQLTATIADRRMAADPRQPVAGAEYFVDVPGEDGTGTPMAPADGSWGGLSESAVAPMDGSMLPLGRHIVLVHGLGGSGRWGPFSAVFLHGGHRRYFPLIIKR